jgi:hypothetical protein
MMPSQIPVLIVGGGPVGLALAGDLGWRGIRCLLIEQSDGSIDQPRQDLGLGADACDAAPLMQAAGERGVPMRFVPLDEPQVLALYERRLVLVRRTGTSLGATTMRPRSRLR